MAMGCEAGECSIRAGFSSRLGRAVGFGRRRTPFTGADWGPRMAPGAWSKGGPRGRSVRVAKAVVVGRLPADGLLDPSACPPRGLPPMLETEKARV